MILTFVISARLPYQYDIKNILALPSGLSYRTRWRERWVQPELRSSLDELTGGRALFMLRDPENERVYPLRYARVLSARKISEVYYFESSLSNLVVYPSAELAAAEYVDECNHRLAADHGNFGYGGPENGDRRYVFRSDTDPACSDRRGLDDLDAWGRVVQAIASVSAFAGDEFLRVVGIAELERSPRPVADGHIVLDAGVLYSLEVFQTVAPPHPKPPRAHDVQLLAPDEHISLLHSRQRAVGNYDALKFLFRTAELHRPELSFVEVQPLPPAHTENTQGRQPAPSLYLPVHIAPKLTWLSAARLLVAVSSLVVFLFPEVLGLPSDEEFPRNVAMVAFVLAAADKDWVKAFMAKLPSLGRGAGGADSGS